MAGRRSDRSIARRRIPAPFFKRDPVTCARELIGATLVVGDCAGRVTETEAYAAQNDPACHTHFRPSARAFIRSHPAGAAYVYLNYGMYWLANVLVKGGDRDGFVLLRGLAPLEGIEQMRERRNRRPIKDLCSGPGKLTIAMGIDGRHHQRSFIGRNAPFWFVPAASPQATIASPRIGISRAIHRKWRFNEEESR